MFWGECREVCIGDGPYAQLTFKKELSKLSFFYPERSLFRPNAVLCFAPRRFVFAWFEG